jgi:hypothetical protein
MPVLFQHDSSSNMSQVASAKTFGFTASSTAVSAAVPDSKTIKKPGNGEFTLPRRITTLN